MPAYVWPVLLLLAAAAAARKNPLNQKSFRRYQKTAGRKVERLRPQEETEELRQRIRSLYEQGIYDQDEILSLAAEYPSEAEALDFYKGWSQKLRNRLRSKESLSPKEEGLVRRLDSVTTKWGAKTPFTAYRGIIVTEEKAQQMFTEGATFSDESYVSTTVSPKTGESFAGLSGYLMSIRVPKGARAMLIDDGTPSFPGEQEVLLPRGSRFRVLAVNHVQRKIDMELVV